MGPMRQKTLFSFFTKLLNKIQNIFTLLKYHLYWPHHSILEFSSRHCIKKKIENMKYDILSFCSPTLGTSGAARGEGGGRSAMGGTPEWRHFV